MTDLIFYAQDEGGRRTVGAARVLNTGEIVAEGPVRALIDTMRIPDGTEEEVVAYIRRHVRSPYLYARPA